MRLTPPYTSRLIEFESENVTTTSNYAIIKVKNNYSSEILNFYLNSEYVKKQIYKYSEQTSIKVINITNIKNFDVITINSDKTELYAQLIQTFEDKKKVIEKELTLEENLIEEMIFGEELNGNN